MKKALKVFCERQRSGKALVSDSLKIDVCGGWRELPQAYKIWPSSFSRIKSNFFASVLLCGWRTEYCIKLSFYIVQFSLTSDSFRFHWSKDRHEGEAEWKNRRTLQHTPTRDNNDNNNNNNNNNKFQSFLETLKCNQVKHQNALDF